MVSSPFFRSAWSLLIFSGLLQGQTLFQKPVRVLGDPSFVGTASSPLLLQGEGPNAVEGRELNSPAAVALDKSVSPPILYIADAGNHRVLGYQYGTQFTPGALADVVLGQIDRFSNFPQGPGARSTGLNSPTGLAVDASGNVYVADSGNNRILRFPKPMSQPAGALQLPDLVIGQTSFGVRTANAGGIGAATLSLASSGAFVRAGLAFDSAGNLWAADTFNNRVLRFPVASLNANGPKADLVVGQPDFTTTTAAGVQNSKTGLNQPFAVGFDAAGRLLVVDAASRVLVYGSSLSTNGPAALRIAGIDTSHPGTQATQIQLTSPFGVTASVAGVIVADAGNNRIMLYPPVDLWPSETTQFSPSATEVIGHTSYTISLPNQGNGDASASSLNAPLDVAVSSNELYVADFANNRVLVFALNPSGANTAASRVIGQLDFPYFAPNLIEGKEFSFSAGFPSRAILDNSANPPHLYVADSGNNRILGFKDFTHLASGLQGADLVIGQPDFKRSQINYPTNAPATPNQQGLYLPSGLAIDSAGNLYVADSGNSRVLRFPAPFASGKTALESADLVIGQSSFTTTVTDATAQTLRGPSGIALSADAADASKPNSGWLIVSDTQHNRVLLYPKPFSNGMSAAKVLGAQNFTTALTGSSDPPRFSGPRGVAVDSSDRVIVADAGNHRVQIFNSAGSINNFDAPPVSLTSGLNVPLGIAPAAVGFWVADANANSLIHFPGFDQLLLGNKTSDSTLPVIAPTSAFSDTYGNLVVCDGANRVLYFVPQATAVSAATYSKRALAPGMFAAVFPSVSTNVLAPGTDAATGGHALPTTLSDIQVLINNNPAPLFFVSPGQVNVQLSNSLPGGGAADLQIIRQSTGQIYAGAELALATTDPGLFTTNGTGGGPVAAINVADGSVNSPLNPVARGQYISLYGTGQGFVPNAPPDGQFPTTALPSASTPIIQLGPQGSLPLDPANVTYSGLAPFLVGVWQINILIPANAPTGSVPVTIFQNSVPSSDQAGTVGAATIAIK